jgi:hypothetical protein
MGTMKKKEITRIGGIATISGNRCYISLPRSWCGKRVFALLKDDHDRIRQREENAKVRVQTDFVNALLDGGGASVSQGNQHQSHVARFTLFLLDLGPQKFVRLLLAAIKQSPRLSFLTDYYRNSKTTWNLDTVLVASASKTSANESR